MQKICDTCRNPEIRVVPSAKPFNLIGPMLAKRAKNWRTVTESMKGSNFVVEPKFDGERVLIHKVGDEIKMTTRNRYDVTDLYGPCLSVYVKKATKGSKCGESSNDFLSA